MRRIAVFLLLAGLVVAVVATFSGCGSLFGWNGRHAVDLYDLPEGPSSHRLVPVVGRRYTLGIQVVFDREGAAVRDGSAVVDAKLPLVVQVKDPAGTSRAGAAGWVDPNEPPNVLYGQTVRASTRGPMPELVVERLVGPFVASSDAPLSIEIDLGADRIGTSSIAARRVVVHDDVLPPNIRNAFLAAAAGALAFVVGSILVAVSWLRGRRPSKKRGGSIGVDVVQRPQ